MSETVFKQLLGEMLESEFVKFAEPPKWKFSLKHRLAMKRIFARYERNVHELKVKKITQNAQTKSRRLSFKQRLIIVLIIVFLLTITGCGITMFISRDFHGIDYSEYTYIYAVNLENAPATIEYKYFFKTVPAGFELDYTDSIPTNSYTRYENELTKQTITLQQCVKSDYTPHINTEYYVLEDVDINGTTGVCIEISATNIPQTFLLWDNGDYVIEVVADLTKEELVNLCKSTNFEIAK